MKTFLRLFAIVLMTLLTTSCARSAAPAAAHDREGVTAAAPAHAHHGDGLAADAPLAGMSIYQVDTEWTDQHGATRRLAELAGRPQAIAMVYTNCGSACPRIVGDMKRLEAAFPELGLILVSIDPERDTPGRLHEFAEGSQLGERWTLLAAPDDQVVELAAVLGVRYRRISDEDFMHSNVITVLDAQGNAVYRQEALGEVEGTKAALRELFARP